MIKIPLKGIFIKMLFLFYYLIIQMAAEYLVFIFNAG